VKEKIYVIGAGYVGLSIGLAFSNSYEVVFIDNDLNKLRDIRLGKSPIKENDLDLILNKNLKRIITQKNIPDIQDKSLIFIAVPTNYNEVDEKFDTYILDNILKELSHKAKKSKIIIKSTVPIGFTEKARKRYSNNNIYFSPEFLREGKSYFDVTHPDRIIISPSDKYSKYLLEKMRSVTNLNKKSCLSMESNVAEAVKLFSNSFLAMRVAFFNEVDSFAKLINVDAKNLLDGICLDSRIGMSYNNPSFGFGGYCLPKDLKQTVKELEKVPSPLVNSVIDSNNQRIKFLAKDIKKNYKNKKIGIYRLTMKFQSDNIRSSSTELLVREITRLGLSVTLYEPLVKKEYFKKNKKIFLENNLNKFLKNIDVIISNRKDDVILNTNLEVYSRDIYKNN
jgi:UDPglucose 6-dehydrogenase